MSRRFVSIWLPYLHTDLITLKKPDLRHVPIVVVKASHGRMLITATNTLAETKGIHKGMVLANARAIYPSLQSFDEKPGIEDKVLQRLAQWCIRFTPYASVDPSSGVLLDVSGCCHLWNGDTNYLKTINTRIREKGFHVKSAMADTIGAAWALSRYTSISTVIESGKQVEAIQLLPARSLRIDNDICERLHKLGLHYIKDILGMKKSALSRRFGNTIVTRLNQAVGTEQEFIIPIIPVEPFRERLPSLEPIVTKEGIEIALETLLIALCKTLSQEAKGIREAVFTCYRVDNKEISVNATTSAASLNTLHLMKMFALKIPSIEPALGIELFVLEATLVDDYQPKQEEFWKQSGRLDDHRISEFVDRVSSRIGSDKIFRYLPAEHYWPERSMIKTTSLTETSTTTWKVDKPRPMRLLPSPELIQVTAPIPDYPPILFRYKGKVHKIIKADGPERIEQEWWIQDGQHRDYYAVQDEEGGRYWLFRLGHYDADKTHSWYLHGLFA